MIPKLMLTLLSALCLFSIVCSEKTFTDSQKAQLVDFINTWRRMATPEGSNLQKMCYDPALEQKASDIADSCPVSATEDANHFSFMAWYDFTPHGLSTFYKEFRSKYAPSTDRCQSCSSKSTCALPKQIFTHNSEKVGCGTKTCQFIVEGEQTEVSILHCLFDGPQVDGQPAYDEGAACSNCPPGYVCEDKLCVPSDPDKACPVNVADRPKLPSSITDAGKEAIVTKINQLRQKPPSEAAAMRKVCWSEELATFAEELTNGCFTKSSIPSRPDRFQYISEHKKLSESDTSPTAFINFIGNTDNISVPPPYTNCDPKSECGLLKQLYQSRTTEIGCAMSKCYLDVYVDVYCVMNELQVDGVPAYVEGTACSKCDEDEQCVSNLCIPKSGSKCPLMPPSDPTTTTTAVPSTSQVVQVEDADQSQENNAPSTPEGSAPVKEKIPDNDSSPTKEGGKGDARIKGSEGVESGDGKNIYDGFSNSGKRLDPRGLLLFVIITFAAI